jgi:ribosomal protein S12 methylthiotransferase accessory factor
LEAAIASGVMESIENYHAEHIDALLLYGSYNELADTHPVVDIAGLPRLATAGDCAGDKRLWIESKSLFDGSPRYLPYEIVSTDYRLPLPPGAGAFPMTSNGLASGNHPLEAISHGLCELVERDSATLWSFCSESERARRRIDAATVVDGPCRATLNMFSTAEIDVLAFEITSDIGIPAFRCDIADRAGSTFRQISVVSGYGCHPRREIALSRALTEAAQGRLTLISGSRDDITQRWYDEARITAEVKQFNIFRSTPGPLRDFNAGETWSATTIDEDVDWELDRLRGCGFDQAFVVDLTTPEFDIPVCRVVVPGLEAFHEVPGFVPGPRATRLIAPSQ